MAAFMAAVEAIERTAEKHGLKLKVNRVAGKGAKDDVFHVAIYAGRFKVADYWPSSGTLLVGGRRPIDPKRPMEPDANLIEPDATAALKLLIEAVANANAAAVHQQTRSGS